MNNSIHPDDRSSVAPPSHSLRRCFYFDTIDNFISQSPEEIKGILSAAHQHSFHSLQSTQGWAWDEEIQLLQKFLHKFSGRGSVIMEFNIPRMGRYIDVLLIIDGVVFVIEFKVFKESFIKSDVAQVLEYVYDLHNFHEPSHDKILVPILMATEAKNFSNEYGFSCNPRIFKVLQANANTLKNVIDEALKAIPPQKSFDTEKWVTGRYYPTPDIIEVSRLLYSGHEVDEISRNDASAKSLKETTDIVLNVVEDSKKNNKKSICFVTGVPGAGKTLVGLNLASKHLADDQKLAAYLTGNFPLCAVLQEALARDAVLRDKMSGKSTNKLTLTKARSEVKRSIQMVHHYRDEGIKTLGAEDKKEGLMAEHVVIFDEAQRAWTKEQLENFMSRKKGRQNFRVSEAEFLMSCINRHKDWGVVVCLVGGGQDINTGEAGISEWFYALQKEEFKDWHIHVSDKLSGAEYESGDAYRQLSMRDNFHTESALHLSVSNRSFRAENLSHFVHNLLNRNAEKAREIFSSLKDYPLVITRDIKKAKKWIRAQSEQKGGRYGIVASSAGERLRPESVVVRLKANVVHWFLSDENDVRSSMYMEDVATEFDIQGLELDWVCLAWDADFRYDDNGWKYFSFSGGNKWNNIKNEDRRRYRLNAYRVLLTRARQGMVIFIPEGDSGDPTRLPEFYDFTYNYLKSLGLPEI